MNELTDSTVITDEMIELVERHNACIELLDWLRERPRTWGELKSSRSYWAAWAMATIPDFPIDLSGLSSLEMALVIAYRKDYPADLSGLQGYHKAWVMVRRNDCPLDYSGLSDTQKANVKYMRKRVGWPV